jgi:hypothetical protein
LQLFVKLRIALGMAAAAAKKTVDVDGVTVKEEQGWKEALAGQPAACSTGIMWRKWLF